MTNILYLRCSPRGAAAFSSRMAEEVVARSRQHHLGAEIVFRDLFADPPRLIDAGFSAAILGPPGEVAPALEASELLIRELEAADVLVIATPMHNYCVPAVLKAWIDQIVRIHRSFASTPGGRLENYGTGPPGSSSPLGVGSAGPAPPARQPSRIFSRLMCGRC